jgi:ABC-2 type transport system ATP-binding protein
MTLIDREKSDGSVPKAGAALLSADRVRVQFGRLRAVADVSFELRGGDLLGLIGPNGAGKTTLLRGLCGLQTLSGGRVRAMGEEVSPGRIEAMRYIGFTPDTPAVYEDLSVRDYLRFIGRGYGLDDQEARERIDFWLEQVWLSEKADQKVKALSRGMRQRIGIARTLLPNPVVILLDEPAGGLDPAGRVQFRQLLRSLREQGKALIVSSHILADMHEYCTHIGIMAHGRMVRFGTVSQVVDGGGEERCRYTLRLSRPVAGLGRMLEEVEGVKTVEADSDRAVLEYARTADEAAGLLAELIRRGVPVCSFAPNAPDLEETYLRTGIRQVD